MYSDLFAIYDNRNGGLPEDFHLVESFNNYFDGSIIIGANVIMALIMEHLQSD